MPRIQFPTWYLWWLPSSCGMLDSLRIIIIIFVYTCARIFPHWKFSTADDLSVMMFYIIHRRWYGTRCCCSPFRYLFIFIWIHQKEKKKKERNYTWNDKNTWADRLLSFPYAFKNKKKNKMKENLQNKKISLCAFMMSRWCRFQWPPRFLYCCCCCVMDERVDGKWEEAPDSSSFFSYCSFSLESNDGAPADMFLLLYDAQLVLFSWQQLISKEKRRNNSAGFPSSLQQ